MTVLSFSAVESDVRSLLNDSSFDSTYLKVVSNVLPGVKLVSSPREHTIGYPGIDINSEEFDLDLASFDQVAAFWDVLSSQLRGTELTAGRLFTVKLRSPSGQAIFSHNGNTTGSGMFYAKSLNTSNFSAVISVPYAKFEQVPCGGVKVYRRAFTSVGQKVLSVRSGLDVSKIRKSDDDFLLALQAVFPDFKVQLIDDSESASGVSVLISGLDFSMADSFCVQHQLGFPRTVSLVFEEDRTSYVEYSNYGVTLLYKV